MLSRLIERADAKLRRLPDRTLIAATACTFVALATLTFLVVAAPFDTAQPAEFKQHAMRGCFFPIE